MEIIPAIDIKSGKCVRLFQGDFQKETVFSDDPGGTALRWQREGALRLHIVDLDGAVKGEPVNIGAIKEILESVEIPLQVGGGVRSLETAENLLELGVDRVVLGTVAVHQPAIVSQVCIDHGSERVVVAVDARDGWVSVKGWTQSTSVSAKDLVKQMEDVGATRFLFTDISRDGTLEGPNFEAIISLVESTESPILASGGASSEGDVRRLAASGVEGVILGRALYTGDLSLSSAINAANKAA